jgi:predicted Co/Zn/Cd cation transporter (cation efflux family)
MAHCCHRIRDDGRRLEDSTLNEPVALRLSLIVSLLIGAVGVAWGLIADSRVVLFDGIFAIFGTALTGLSLLASRAAGLDPDHRYPFGRKAWIPVAVVVQGAALAGTIAYAAIDAISVILSGGSTTAPVSVVGYGVVSLVAALAVALALPRLAPGSDLVAAEAAQWRAGTLLSAIIAIGAGVAAGASRLGWEQLAPYADPVLVLIAVAVLAPVPLRLLRAGGLELLEAAPPPEIAGRIETEALRVAAENGLGKPIIRATKLGQRLYVEVDFIVEPGKYDISDEDRVRRSMIAGLTPLGFDLWANVELTTDPSLTE